SVHDYYEVYYHAFLAGMFKWQYPHTTSNYESGLGRGDIVIKDPDNNRAAVVEIKRSDTNDSMSSSADRALRQIADMKYDAPLQGEYPVILHWGIACHDKSCVAKSVDG
ncbi:MAG: PD-(D/E)XK nuclease domain-containing protein, partial [Desulfovibrionaceae bacterium]|nr:PD-(D/E)XK nuclease domain-containing protein [Desulfovibrionaceae bacterium]